MGWLSQRLGFKLHSSTSVDLPMRHVISCGVGRRFWLGIPYSDNIPVNIIIDQ
jgi:hypothetical protein